LVKGAVLKADENQALVRNGYNANAERYDAGREQFHNQDVLEQFMALVRPHGAVLDVGCGAGVPVASFLVEQGLSVTGIDISDSMLRLASARVPQARFLKMDMTNMADLADSSVDGVVACYSLIHVQMELHQRVISEFARLLRPGGVLLFSSGRAEWEGVEEFYGAPMFWSHPHPKLTRKYVLDAGFELEFAEVRQHGGEHHYWVLAHKAA
jgi:ubiquinone/menaquinone biosynthesis C-methylase UbiE